MSSETHKQKRKILKGLSELAKELQKDECSEFTINEILIEHFYKTEIHQTFETLHNWSKKGFSVKKGETAFLIWGKPKRNNEDENLKKNNNEDDKELSDFYPLCYLFSNAQVIERNA